MDNLVEKLTLRFKNCKESRHARDISYCLLLIPYTSDKSVKKLLDALPLYRMFLNDSEVCKIFNEVVSKVFLIKLFIK